MIGGNNADIQIVPCTNSKHYILFVRFLMAHFLRLSSAFHADRRDCLRLLGFLLSGSILGALFARLRSDALSTLRFDMTQGSWIPIFLRSSLFPCLMAVSFLLRRRWLFCCLFFGKGFFVAFSLSVIALSGRLQFLCFFPPFLNHALLLPMELYVGSVWLRKEDAGGALWLLFPLLFLAFFGVLIQTSLVS